MPAKKPNEIHILEGTDRTTRGTNVVFSVTNDSLSEEPTLQELSDIDREVLFESLKSWVCDMTGQYKIDQYLLSMLVDQYTIYAVSKMDVEERGVLLEGPKGKYVNHALYNMNTAHDKIVKMMQEFGMTPKTRSGVKASNQMEKDPLDDFLNKQGKKQ